MYLYYSSALAEQTGTVRNAHIYAMAHHPAANDQGFLVLLEGSETVSQLRI